MKSLRLDRWASQLQPPRNPRLYLLAQRCPFSSIATVNTPRRPLQQTYQQTQVQCINQRRSVTKKRKASTVAAQQTQPDEALWDTSTPSPDASGQQLPLNFPSHRKAVKSAKLAALHARLSLPSRLPLETLARCLIDHSVDPRPGYNNAPLAILGQELLAYYTSEWLICKYPRIPMSVLFAAQYGYTGDATLNAIRAEWGVEHVAAPGPEVNAGLLQLKRVTPGNTMAADGARRLKDVQKAEERERRRGLTQRILEDNEFGESGRSYELPSAIYRPYAGSPISQSARSGMEEDTKQVPEEQPLADGDGVSAPGLSPAALLQLAGKKPVDAEAEAVTVETASAGFVRALAGALYLHAGTDAIKAFHKAHILSRHLPLHSLFAFQHPTRDLSLLCSREGYEPPVARLISETGRLSRTPVFVVGVFSGNDKLGEAAGASLDEGRVRAAAAALRSWYLYSPPDSELVLPSEVEGSQKNKTWKPQHVDPGEIIF